jgi:hypothetical protein
MRTVSSKIETSDCLGSRGSGRSNVPQPWSQAGCTPLAAAPELGVLSKPRLPAAKKFRSSLPVHCAPSLSSGEKRTTSNGCVSGLRAVPHTPAQTLVPARPQNVLDYGDPLNSSSSLPIAARHNYSAEPHLIDSWRRFPGLHRARPTDQAYPIRRRPHRLPRTREPAHRARLAARSYAHATSVLLKRNRGESTLPRIRVAENILVRRSGGVAFSSSSSSSRKPKSNISSASPSTTARSSEDCRAHCSGEDFRLRQNYQPPSRTHGLIFLRIVAIPQVERKVKFKIV